MTYREARMKAEGLLRAAGIENEAAESLFLMEAACGVGRTSYLLRESEEMDGRRQEAYAALTKKRCERIPLQHLTGEQEFMGLPFLVNRNVLIPRQDTEILVERALEILGDWEGGLASSLSEPGKPGFLECTGEPEEALRVPDPSASMCSRRVQGKPGRERRESEPYAPLRSQCEQPGPGRALRVLDLCTGSGCIAVSVGALCPRAEVTASDISGKALAVAEENAKRNRVSIEFIRSDLFSEITGTYDMILSNPPYIPSGDILSLMPEVRDHEPSEALDGGEDGLCFYREIAGKCGTYLNPGGCLLLEVGSEQGRAVSALLRENGFSDIEVIPDLAGLDRVVMGRRKQDV